MGDLSLRFSAANKVSKGDIGATVENGALVLPVEIKPVVDQMRLKTAADFFNGYTTFPSSFAAAAGSLGSKDEFETAKAKLKQLLRGHVPDEALDFVPIQRAYGALPPPGARGKTVGELKPGK